MEQIQEKISWLYIRLCDWLSGVLSLKNFRNRKPDVIALVNLVVISSIISKKEEKR